MQKRYYHGPLSLGRDLAGMIRDLRRMRALRSSTLVDAAFRERLMLTVTEVNGCRYCAWAHARMALSAGLSAEDIQALTEGELKDVPAGQVAAVLYAQHWAETDGVPDPEARARIVDTYGTDKAESLEIYMRMMRVGNLVGNSWDQLLSRVSGGRWGERSA
jgi:AhpD family alkylhydroperoxidase